jgi:hypothetical protein
MPNAILLIDHANIDFRESDLNHLLDVWLSALCTHDSQLRKIVDVDIRVYGGWNQDGKESDARYQASAFYQSSLPSIKRVGDIYFRLTFRFAETLITTPIMAPSLRFENTVTTRTSFEPIIVHNGSCDSPNCELKIVRRWLNKKLACTSKNCIKSFGDIFHRREQKQVDVHLSIDAVLAVRDIDICRHIAVVSADLDIIPALCAAIQHNTSKKHIYLIKPKPYSFYCDDYLESNGLTLIYL